VAAYRALRERADDRPDPAPCVDHVKAMDTTVACRGCAFNGAEQQRLEDGEGVEA
jgi:hypothetical protein